MRHHLDEEGIYDPPTPQLGGFTVVHDRNRNRQVMRIRGVVVLPVGAEVELTEPNVNAVVEGVRLLAGSNTLPVHVCLDVKVPGKYWGEEETLDVLEQDIAQQIEGFTGT